MEARRIQQSKSANRKFKRRDSKNGPTPLASDPDLRESAYTKDGPLQVSEHRKTQRAVTRRCRTRGWPCAAGKHRMGRMARISTRSCDEPRTHRNVRESIAAMILRHANDRVTRKHYIKPPTLESNRRHETAIESFSAIEKPGFLPICSPENPSTSQETTSFEWVQ